MSSRGYWGYMSLANSSMSLNIILMLFGNGSKDFFSLFGFSWSYVIKSDSVVQLIVEIYYFMDTLGMGLNSPLIVSWLELFACLSFASHHSIDFLKKWLWSQKAISFGSYWGLWSKHYPGKWSRITGADLAVIILSSIKRSLKTGSLFQIRIWVLFFPRRSISSLGLKTNVWTTF